MVFVTSFDFFPLYSKLTVFPRHFHLQSDVKNASSHETFRFTHFLINIFKLALLSVFIDLFSIDFVFT